MIIWTKLNTMLNGFNRRLAASCIAPIGILCLLGVVPVAAAAKPVDAANCQDRLAIDYLEPISELPPVRQVPRSGRLPFAGEGTTLRPVSQSQVNLNGTSVGYALSLDGPLARFDPSWQVEAQLLRIGSDGAARKLIQRRERFLGVPRSLRELDFSFRLRSKPGLYKYEIRFLREDGRALGSYSRYLRIVKPRLGGDLRLSANSTTPGSSLQFQIANLGTVPFAASMTPTVERWDVTGWTNAGFPQGRTTLEGRPAIHKALRLEAGVATGCFEVAIPTSAATGLYRISLQISPLSLPSRFVRNRFEVLMRSLKSE